MTCESFDFGQFIRGRASGQKTLASAMRNLTADEPSTTLLKESLSDRGFLEPRLFAWHFGSFRQEMDVVQLVYGELLSYGAVRTHVKSDLAGTVFLAGVGSLCSEHRNATLQLEQHDDQSPIILRLAQDEVDFDVEATAYVPGTEIEIVWRVDPVLRGFFKERVDATVPLELVADPLEHIPQISRALCLIEAASSDFHTSLLSCLRSIVLFQHPTVQSFAALGIHGMIFVNICRPTSTVFFLDALVHQGGHLIFSEATLDRQRYFSMAPDTKLVSILHKADPRTIYEALHGLYTEYALLEVMQKIGDTGDIEIDHSLELRGRIALIQARFAADLNRFSSNRHIFSNDGLELFDYFQKFSDETATRRPQGSFDLQDQPDEFDLTVFLKRNGAVIS